MDTTEIIFMIIKLLWSAFLIYIFVWIIVFSFYDTKPNSTGIQKYTLFFILCLFFVPLFFICMSTLPDNYEISIGWFIGLGFTSVIFGFIYYFKYLKEFFLALTNEKTVSYTVTGNSNNDSKQYINTLMEPIAPFLSDSETKILFALSKYANKFMEIVE